MFFKDRLGIVEVGGHPRILRTAAWEHEHQRLLFDPGCVGKDALRVIALEKMDRFLSILCRKNATLLEGSASVHQRERNVRKRLLGMILQVFEQPSLRFIERGL